MSRSTVEKALKENPGAAVTMVHDEILIEVVPPGALMAVDEIARANEERQRCIDKAREFIANIQAKDEEQRTVERRHWVARPEPQYIHTGCGKLAVIIRVRQCSWVKDELEPWCDHCKVIVHTLVWLNYRHLLSGVYHFHCVDVVAEQMLDEFVEYSWCR